MSDQENPIILSGVSKSFGRNQALQKISYTVEPGTVFALLGENGAGKTTTIKLLLGQLQPDAGEVRVLGQVPQASDKALRRRIGYVPETVFLYNWMTVEELGRFAAPFYSKEYWPEYVRLAESFGLPLRTKIQGLSKGMKAETSLALTLAANPELLILDEPTSGLDALVRRRFLESMVDLAGDRKDRLSVESSDFGSRTGRRSRCYYEEESRSPRRAA